MNVPCAECGRVSPGSPSDYFCSDTCQQRWYAKQIVDHSPDEPGRRRQAA